MMRDLRTHQFEQIMASSCEASKQPQGGGRKAGEVRHYAGERVTRRMHSPPNTLTPVHPSSSLHPRIRQDFSTTPPPLCLSLCLPLSPVSLCLRLSPSLCLRPSVSVSLSLSLHPISIPPPTHLHHHGRVVQQQPHARVGHHTHVAHRRLPREDEVGELDAHLNAAPEH